MLRDLKLINFWSDLILDHGRDFFFSTFGTKGYYGGLLRAAEARWGYASRGVIASSIGLVSELRRNKKIKNLREQRGTSDEGEQQRGARKAVRGILEELEAGRITLEGKPTRYGHCDFLVSHSFHYFTPFSADCWALSCWLGVGIEGHMFVPTKL